MHKFWKIKILLEKGVWPKGGGVAGEWGGGVQKLHFFFFLKFQKIVIIPKKKYLEKIFLEKGVWQEEGGVVGGGFKNYKQKKSFKKLSLYQKITFFSSSKFQKKKKSWERVCFESKCRQVRR